MGAGELPGDLARARDRFDAWRDRRPVGGRIPQPLWSLAVRLVNRYGVSRTATALGLDYYSLKKRFETDASAGRSDSSAFVEVPAPLVFSKQCQVEFSNGAGASLRVQLVGYDPAEAAAFVCGCWNAE